MVKNKTIIGLKYKPVKKTIVAFVKNKTIIGLKLILVMYCSNLPG